MLSAASEYRNELADLYHRRHQRTIELRDEHHPELFAAMVARERAAAKIFEIERRVKAHHSEVRNRNAVPPELRDSLEHERSALKAARAAYAAASGPWKLAFRARADYWAGLADWKNVKDRAKRAALYESIEWPLDAEAYQAALDAKGRAYDVSELRPALVAALGRMTMELDLAERRLDAQYAAALHSAIRAEIKEACQPKLSKTGPGTRYLYGRPPENRPWEKLSLHFPGGLSVADALAGKSRQLQITQLDQSLYEVVQQIGTAAEPRRLRYVIARGELPPEAVIMRWSHVTRERITRGGSRVYRRYVTPVCAGLAARDVGSGVVQYRLRWTRTRAGVHVATFWDAEGYYERLIVPQWIVERIAAVSDQQAIWDARANALLDATGVNRGRLQGVEALAKHADVGPDARQLLDEAQRALQLAANDARRARGCIEEIYRVAAARLRTRYAAVRHDEIDLAKLKRYDTRDLLREDKLPPASRETLHAVSPGKLRQLLKQSGLAASDADLPPPPDDARESDLLTSYVRSLGVKTGRRESVVPGRSQRTSGGIATT